MNEVWEPDFWELVLHKQSWNCELAKPEVSKQFGPYLWSYMKSKQMTAWNYLEIMDQIH